MAVLLPEKTLEIWTGVAVTGFLPFADIWSPPNYGGSVDQWIRAGKTWAFELKTAYEDTPSPSIPIDLRQLQGHAFRPRHGVPVLYVLPVVPWAAKPVEPVPLVGGEWRTLPWWAWIVTAKQLARRLKVTPKRAPPVTPAKLYTADLPFAHPYPRYRYEGMWLADFLVRVGACSEPKNWVLRVTEESSNQGEPSLQDVQPEDDLQLTYVAVHVPAAYLPGL